MKEIYRWVPWFRELVRRIANEEEAYLIDRARQVEWGGKPSLLQYGDEAIDPFSFFYFLASKNTTNQLKPVYDSVGRVFEIEAPPADADVDDSYIFPTPHFNILFHDGKNFHRDLLWRLYRQVITDDPDIAADEFDQVLEIKGVGVGKLTQTLFLVNPNLFLPVDSSLADLSEALHLPVPAEIESAGYAAYRSLLEKVRNAFPRCQPYEINMFLYLQKSGSIVVSDTFYQISTYVNDPDGGDYWENRDGSFKENNWVYTGGPGSGKTWQEEKGGYPLTEPERGDIILVRTGRQRGRAIGIVHKNDYIKSGMNENSRIHVLWINKTEERLSRVTPIVGFSKAGDSTQQAFEKTDGYKPTFDLIKGLAPKSNGYKPQLHPDALQPGKQTMENPHPLNQILYGPPGTGKTWNTLDYALAIVEDERLEVIQQKVREDKMHRFNELKENGQIEIVTFHQNFTYEDFIEGIRPVLANDAEEDGDLEYKLSRGVFWKIAECAKNKREQNYVLIVDEINRGNIAKIFGELITLIEESKRIGGDDQATVTLPYSKEEFGVPDNLYIIGTMNTADRSIALLDTALRRRFDFIEMMPDSKLVSGKFEGVDCRKLLEAINKRIRFLFDREHQIGHTYFMKIKDMDSLASTFKNQIIPLLQEYFYDDWEKIRLVLNDNGFIANISAKLRKDLSKELLDLVDEEKKIYELLPSDDDKWQDPEPYRKIYDNGKQDGPDESKQDA